MNAESITFAGGYVDITPALPVYLAGMLERREMSRSVTDRLEANAVLLERGDERAVLVQADVLSVGAGTRKRLLDRLAGRLQDRELLLVASHTHFAPNIDANLPGHGVVDQDYIALVIDRIVDLLSRVLSAERRPARLFYREGQAAHSINRRKWCWAPTWSIPPIRRRMALHPNPAGPKDDTVRLFALSGDAEGTTSEAMLWSYCCHPVASYPPNGVSAAYPGAVRRALRDRFGPDLPVVFLPGFSGDVRPNLIDRFPLSPYYLLHRLVNGPVFGRFDRKSSHRWTSSLAEAVLRAASSRPLPIDVSKIRSVRSRIPMRDLMRGSVYDRDLTLHAIHLDPDLSILGVSAEVVIEYATAFSQLLDRRKLLPVGYIDGVAAYLPTSEMLVEGGLEVASPGYGSNLAAYRGDVSDLVLDCVRRLLLAPETPAGESQSRGPL